MPGVVVTVGLIVFFACSIIIKWDEILTTKKSVEKMKADKEWFVKEYCSDDYETLRICRAIEENKLYGISEEDIKKYNDAKKELQELMGIDMIPIPLIVASILAKQGKSFQPVK